MSYDAKLEQGHKFQDFVAEHLLACKGIPLTYYTSQHNQYNIGETRCGVEVKLDQRCTETGRLSIEVGEKQATASDYVPSGTHRQDNTWLYLQGNEQVIYAFSKKVLRRYEQAKVTDYHKLPTIKKWYLPLDVAERLAEFTIRPTTYKTNTMGDK